MAIHASTIYPSGKDPIDKIPTLREVSDCAFVPRTITRFMPYEMASKTPEMKFGSDNAPDVVASVLRNFNTAYENNQSEGASYLMQAFIEPPKHHFCIQSVWHKGEPHFRLIQVFAGYGTVNDWLSNDPSHKLSKLSHFAGQAVKDIGIDKVNEVYAKSREQFGGNQFFSTKELAEGFLSILSQYCGSKTFMDSLEFCTAAFGTAFPQTIMSSTASQMFDRLEGAFLTTSPVIKLLPKELKQAAYLQEKIKSRTGDGFVAAKGDGISLNS